MSPRTILTSAARDFRVTIGLQELYSENSKLHSTDEVKKIIFNLIAEKTKYGYPCLSGAVSEAEIFYPDDEKLCRKEPVAFFEGEMDPLNQNDLSDEKVEDLLNEFADNIGIQLKQEHIYIRFKDKVWVRQVVEEK